jgi:hypothetical protein
MKKFLSLLFPWVFVIVTVMLSACQGADQPGSGAMYRPGDTVNGIRLTTGAADAPPLWAFCSRSQENTHIRTFQCRAPVMPTLAIGHVFLLADEALASLDGSELIWELSIDDQAVDLESFGTFEYVMPGMTKSPSPVREVFKKATAWNVVMTNLNPGEHTLYFKAHSETDSYLWLVNLTIEPEAGTDISSIPFPPKS